MEGSVSPTLPSLLQLSLLPLRLLSIYFPVNPSFTPTLYLIPHLPLFLCQYISFSLSLFLSLSHPLSPFCVSFSLPPSLFLSSSLSVSPLLLHPSSIFVSLSHPHSVSLKHPNPPLSNFVPPLAIPIPPSSPRPPGTSSTPPCLTLSPLSTPSKPPPAPPHEEHRPGE